MSKTLLLRTAVMALVLSVSAVSAELKWDAEEIVVKVPPGTPFAEADFTFTNVGTTAITLNAIVSGCGCLTAKADRMQVPAGEKGVIKAKMNLAGIEATSAKTVAVTSDDPGGAVKVLTLRALIAK